MRVLFCKIGWMKKYEGYYRDKIIGGGSSVDESGEGGEAFNFDKLNNGQIQGYVKSSGDNGFINLERLGGKKHENYVEDILIVWLSKHPEEGKVRVIGWYKNARVYRYWQSPESRTPRNKYGYPYSCLCDSKDAVLIPEGDRDFVIPRATKGEGGYGHSNVWFAEGEKNSKIIDDVLKYIDEYEENSMNDTGFAVFSYSNKKENYVGQWNNNKKSGYGITKLKGQGMYVGQYKDNDYEGNGIFEFIDKEKYIGEFKDGYYHGQGIYVYANGDKYIGGFKESQFDGYGMLIYKNGAIKKGLWKEDKLIQEM